MSPLLFPLLFLFSISPQPFHFIPMMISVEIGNKHDVTAGNNGGDIYFCIRVRNDRLKAEIYKNEGVSDALSCIIKQAN